MIRPQADASDLEKLAIDAYLHGREAEATDLLARAHQDRVRSGEAVRAARCALWIAFTLLFKGERAGAAGWMARSRRLLDEGGHDCVERGYLQIVEAVGLVFDGQITAAHTIFTEADRIGERFADPDLIGLARQGRGRSLIRLGEIPRGVALLDEVMVAVTAGEISPIISGLIYCSVISACMDLLDVRRAREWTEALTRWCETQPDRIPYRGQCLVHRAEILRLRGVWPDALDEARRACVWLSESAPDPVVGAAWYEIAELHRLRGEFADAEEAYRHASRIGRTPHPGLALLRLAQGRVADARAAICRVLDEGQPPRTRTPILAAAVEILLAAEDVAVARHKADELSAIAARIDTPFLHALAAHALGSVLLAEQDAKAALGVFRDACAIWRDLEAPYEAARVTVSIGLACRALGDADSAQIELEAARRVFAQLGAMPDLARLDQFDATVAMATTAAGPAQPAGVLTGREVQVLRLVASGRTNRAIATTLGISEKTVARHVSNIFTKLDLSSRAAATAYAFQHGLVEREPSAAARAGSH